MAAIPFLFTLPATARAAYNAIVAGVRRGLSSRGIESVIRAAGLPISRARSIVPLMRALRITEARGGAVRFIPKASNINTARLPEALTPIRRRFSFNVRVRGIDSLGNLIDRHVTVATDRSLITPGEIEEAAAEMVSEEGQSDTLADVEVTLLEGLQRAEFGF